MEILDNTKMTFRSRRAGALLALWLGADAAGAQTAELKPPTVAAFDAYIRSAETRIDAQTRGVPAFLWVDESPERLRQARTGQILSQPWAGEAEISVPGGLIHDWIGAVFVPGSTLAGALRLAQDYDHHKNIYGPEVVDSKLLSRRDDDYKIYLRLLKKKVLTVVLATEHDVRYFRPGAARCYSRSYSTRIAEVAGAGKPGEHELPPGKDHGFLWRLYSYWRFEERDSGVYVECEAISLTRAVPAGLGWLIEPIIRNLPRESLTNTLRATRAALASR
jgi:hypothetical protein